MTNPKNKDFQLWQQNNHPIVLDSNYLIDQKVDYIHYTNLGIEGDTKI